MVHDIWSPNSGGFRFYCVEGREEFQEGASKVFYCKGRRISRGRLYSLLLQEEKNLKRAPIWLFIVRQEEFQEGASKVLLQEEKNFKRVPIWFFIAMQGEFHEGDSKVFIAR